MKHVGFRIQDEKVWEEFKEYVRKKYGKLHTALAIEATQALREYLKRHAHKHQKEIAPPSLSFSLDGRRARSHKHAYKKEEKKKNKTRARKQMWRG
ncbi:MAG: hypothetical protein QXG35_10170 [Nitrososphaerota archaeon]